MNKYFICLALLTIGLAGCKKNEPIDLETLSGTFLADKTIQVYKAELYTKNGKSVVKNEVANFIKRRALTESFSEKDKQDMGDQFLFKITLDGQGSFSATIADEPYAAGKMEKQSSSIALLIDDKEPDPLIIGGEDCLTKVVSRFTHLIECRWIPSTTGYLSGCISKTFLPIEVKNANSLAIPLYSLYYSKNKMGVSSYCMALDRPNFINEDFYKNLQEGDTVLIQRKEHFLKK
ncbi:hypothetical protein [Pseudopedobacter beijingensis]|uniref:Lipoprotein n=1 Tax=Pseudopedobacter beijingensis TaxID=1207056 RepID=A0ABW4IDI1_9SPHI